MFGIAEALKYMEQLVEELQDAFVTVVSGCGQRRVPGREWTRDQLQWHLDDRQLKSRKSRRVQGFDVPGAHACTGGTGWHGAGDSRVDMGPIRRTSKFQPLV